LYSISPLSTVDHLWKLSTLALAYIYIYVQIIVWIFTGRVRFQDLFVLLLVHWFSKVLFSYSTSWFILFCMLVGGIRIFSNFWGLGFKTFELWFFFLDFMELNVSWCNCWIRVRNLLIGASLVGWVLTFQLWVNWILWNWIFRNVIAGLGFKIF
jgi:hypothetical protein